MAGLLLFCSLAAADLSPVAMARFCDEPRVVLVSEGRSRMPIVAFDGDRERRAALYLAFTIGEITGVRPVVYVETPRAFVTNMPVLRIAKSDGSDRFRVITKGGSVRFLGRSDFAVFDWCERMLGVRYYCNGGKTVPRVRELSVEAVDYADWPVFAHRDNWPFGCQMWSIASKVGGAHRGGVCVHAPHRWFSDPEVRTNHPNIFARQPDGSRGEMPLLCYGNPETLDYYKRRIDEHIAGLRDSGGIVDTSRHVITVSQWDCRLECSCAHCKRLFDSSLGVTGSGSPVIWGFFLKNLATWAANNHPDYTISFLPYLNTCDVPAGLDLAEEGNCEAMLCSMPGLALFKNKAVREREEDLIRRWAGVTGRKVLNWHYACWPREFTSAPYLFGKTIAGHYRRLASCEVGSFINGGDATAAEKLSNYVWLKCLWNPNVDVEAIYDLFAVRMFGPAAEPMRRLMARQEEGWMRAWPQMTCGQANIFDVSYPHEDVEEMKRLLCEAAVRAKGDAKATSRVRWYAADFRQFFRDEERYRKGISFEPLKISPAAVAPKIDGNFDEACWANAEHRCFVAAFPPARQSSRNSVLRRATSVRAVWTNAGIYFAFRCVEPEMDKLNMTAAYGELQKQDTMEIFLQPVGAASCRTVGTQDEKGTCYRLMFDVRNRMVCSASDQEWRAEGVVSAVRCEDDEWRLEIFVPFSAWPDVARPDASSRWRGNFTRWHAGLVDERERSRLSTLGSEWNQDASAFSPFTFLKP